MFTLTPESKINTPSFRCLWNLGRTYPERLIIGWTDVIMRFYPCFQSRDGFHESKSEWILLQPNLHITFRFSRHLIGYTSCRYRKQNIEISWICLWGETIPVSNTFQHTHHLGRSQWMSALETPDPQIRFQCYIRSKRLPDGAKVKTLKDRKWNQSSYPR